MKFKIRFTIAKRLILGFGVLLLAVLSTSLLTWVTLDENMEVNSRINKVYNPSATQLNDLFFIISSSELLIKSWMKENFTDHPDKAELREIHSKKYPEIKERLAELSPKWNKEEQEDYKEIDFQIDSLFAEHQEIMTKLNDDEAYSSTELIFVVIQPKFYENGSITVLTKKIHNRLKILVEKQKENINNANSEMDDSFVSFKKLIKFMAAGLFISVILIAIFTTRSLTIPIHYIKNILLSMSLGILPDKEIQSRTDEIGEMASALNQLVTGLKKTSQFSLKIGEGKFDSEFIPLSEKDVLGNSLIIMRENLIKAEKDSELRRIENNQRNWTSQGIALFSEILRRNNDNMEEFSYEIISNLVKYLKANQGGLFIINVENEDDKHLSLAACYAYERRKYLQKRIDIGVTVIGQCVLEKETIYMTDIPKNYIRITSGLGEDAPTSLLVVPLISNDEVFGVVEIASFSEIESHQIEFVEKVGENIASTIQSIRISNNTSRLLMESQEKSERLALQEEEMRKHIEMMKADQNEEKLKDKEQIVKLKQDYEQKIHDLQSKITDLERKLIAGKIST